MCEEKQLPKNINFLSFNVEGLKSRPEPVPYPEIFWAYRHMYQNRDFNKSIVCLSVRQTDKNYGSIKLLFNAKQLNRVIN